MKQTLLQLIKENKIRIESLDNGLCEQLLEEIKEKKDKEFEERLKFCLEHNMKAYMGEPFYREYGFDVVYELRSLYEYFKVKPFNSVYPHLYTLIKLDKEKQDYIFDNIYQPTWFEIDHELSTNLLENISSHILKNIDDIDWDEISEMELKYDFVKTYKDKLNINILQKNEQLDEGTMKLIGGKYKPDILKRLISLLKKEQEPKKTYAIDENKAINNFKTLNGKIIYWHYTTYYGDGLTIAEGYESLQLDEQSLNDFVRYEYQDKYIIVCEKRDAMIILDINDTNKSVVETLFKNNLGTIEG